MIAPRRYRVVTRITKTTKRRRWAVEGECLSCRYPCDDWVLLAPRWDNPTAPHQWVQAVQDRQTALMVDDHQPRKVA